MVTIEIGLVSFIVVNTDDGDMDGTRNQNSMDISLWGSSSVRVCGSSRKNISCVLNCDTTVPRMTLVSVRTTTTPIIGAQQEREAAVVVAVDIVILVVVMVDIRNFVMTDGTSLL